MPLLDRCCGSALAWYSFWWRYLKLTRLFFADDSLLFQSADDGGIQVFKEVNKKYEMFSRQKVNCQKSSVFFSKTVGQNCRIKLAEQLGMLISDGKGKYLGLPYMIGRSKQ